ncbi:ankyrin repeat domain-containing protein 16 [Hyalella azteca]|uniref:Ankyrin repeat domain-containing protein 16 n=1 Tax=Hyalella azteca TaxID=294128 RepID=A0A8B7NZF0_HYAAZ|nr:ankyrin repeat domain-containing protein 16 [Hyalella azteca]
MAKEIFAALKKHDLHALENILLAQGQPIIWPSIVQKSSQDTALHLASKYLCSADIIRYLLDQGAGVCLEQRNTDGKRPLHEAAQCGNLAAVKILILAGSNVDSLNRAEWTPLMMAASKPSTESLCIVKELIAAGSNLALLNKDGWSAAHICCRSGSVDVLQLLLLSLEHCCCISSKNGRTALHTAALHGRTDVLEALREHCSCCLNSNRKDQCGLSPFMDAACGGHVGTARALISLWPDTDVRLTDARGRSALQIASETGQLETVKFLVQELLLDPQHCDIIGQNCVHSAARAGHSHVLQWLISCAGCPADTLDHNGRSALDLASAANHSKCVELLSRPKTSPPS